MSTETAREEALRLTSGPGGYRPEGVYRGKCLICTTRPTTPGRAYCGKCAGEIARQTPRKDKPRPAYAWITWRGLGVQLVAIDKHSAMASAVTSWPKTKALNLDEYCPGYTREQIKRFKRILLMAQKGPVQIVR